MKLWIGRHSFAGPVSDDPEQERSRSLTSEGRAIAKAIGRKLAKQDDKPLVIFSSPYQRALETADIYGKALGIRVNVVGDLAPDRPLSPTLKNLLSVTGDEKMKRVMLVGHVDNTTPAMTELADGEKWKDLVMGEVRQLDFDRDSMEWHTVWKVKPSDVGLRDYDKAPGKGGVTGRNATDTVLEQLEHDFPDFAIKWVAHADASWTGPTLVQLADVDYSDADKWRAAQEPDKVAKFTRYIARGRMKPLVGARGPGQAKVRVLDGHHRALAYRELKAPVLMYVAEIASAVTMADAVAMHSRQFAGASEMSNRDTSTALLDLGPADVHVPGARNDKKKKQAQTPPEPKPGVTNVDKKRMTRISAKLGKGGSLHIRHLSEWAPCVELKATDEDGPTWIQIAKQGAFRGHRQGEFRLDTTTFSEVIRNFEATANRRIPIDYEHASEQDPTSGNIPYGGAPAQGWITQLEMRNGELWGLVDWGAQAREQIRAGQYMFFSPAFRFGVKDRVSGRQIGTVMSSGALTNKPFLDGMAPLAARDDGGDFQYDEAGFLIQLDAVELSSPLAFSTGDMMPKLRASMGLGPLSSPKQAADTMLSLRAMARACNYDMGATIGGVKLGDHLMPMRDLVGRPGMTWDDVLDVVDQHIADAIREHEARMHPEGGNADVPPAPDSRPPPPGAYETQYTADDTGTAGEDDMAMSDAEKAHLEQLSNEVKTLTTKVSELTVKLSEAETSVTTLTTERDTLKKDKDDRELRELNDRVSGVLKSHPDKVKELGATDEERTVMLTDLYKNSRTFFDKSFPLAAKPAEAQTDLPRSGVLLSVEPLVKPEHKDDPRAVMVDVANESFSQTVTRLMNIGDPVAKKPMNYDAAQKEARRVRRAAGLSA